jgi:hypothetical protein
MKWLERCALTPCTCGKGPLHEEEVGGHTKLALSTCQMQTHMAEAWQLTLVLLPDVLSTKAERLRSSILRCMS